jgi:type IV pilus assembly protein PilM
MGLFSSKETPNFLGVDIGGSSIKMVELTNNNGRAQLVTYGFLERSLAGDVKLIDAPDKTAELIKNVVAQSKVVTKKVVTALPAAAVYSSIIALPQINKKDLSNAKKIAEAVEWEAKKVLPMPIEEMVLDWKLLGIEEKMKKEEKKEGDKKEDDKKEKEDDGEEKLTGVQVLLTAAAKEVVQKYIAIFKKAGLDLISLETESFALARSMVGKDKSLVLLVDIGAVNTDIAVIENGIPLMTRSVSVGGYQISKGISQILNIEISQAEQFKRDLEGNAQELTGEDTLPDVVRQPIQAIMDEIQYTVNFYLDQPENKGKRVEKIVLSGGTANLFNLPKYFTEQLNIKTFIGNPWARVIFPQDLHPILEALGPRLATSIGLAMRDIES